MQKKAMTRQGRWSTGNCARDKNFYPVENWYVNKQQSLSENETYKILLIF